MSHLDSALFALETPTNHMHLGLLGLFERSDLDVIDLLRKRLQSGAADLQELRSVIRPSWVGAATPLLVDGGPLDLDYHVQRTVLVDANETDLDAWVADRLSTPLDRSHPLWQIDVVEGLQSGGFALFVKGHHGVYDGVAALRCAMRIFDGANEKPLRRKNPDVVNKVVAGVRFAPGSVVDVLHWPLRFARVLTDPTRARVRLAGFPAGPRMFTAPRTPLNVSISAERTVARASLSQAEVREVRREANCTGNDVVVAVVSSSVRRLLQKRNALPRRSLVAMVPAAQTGDDWEKDSGNRLAFWFVSMASNVSRPRERLSIIAESSKAARSAARLRGAELWERYAGALLPRPLHWGVRLSEALKVSNVIPPLATMIVSNLTGPRHEMRLGGAKMVGLWPFGPPKDGGAVNVTMVSYGDTVYVGIQGDRKMHSEVAELAEGLAGALAELRDPNLAEPAPKAGFQA